MRFIRKMLPFYLISIVAATVCSMLISQSDTAIRIISVSAELSSLPTVVLDPGHGGEDGGAVATDGIHESKLNLEIGLRTRDLLRFLGLPVILTRESDVSIHSPEAQTVSGKKVSDLNNRVQIANKTPGSILVSIHQNMFSESKYRGAQVFYAETAESQALAERLQAVFDDELDPSNHRQAKPSESIYLLSQISCPGILVECGFLSNPEEERLLQTEDYQKQLAASICAALTRQLAEIQSN